MTAGILTSARLWLIVGAAICGTAVALGAYGWHDLEGDASARDIFMLAVQYQMWHGIGCCIVAWRTDVGGKAAAAAALAGACFAAGVGLFCGNLYVFAVTGNLPIAGAAPMGGLAFMAGWGLLAVSALMRR